MNKHDSKREGMETERCPSSVGSNPTPRTTDEPTVFWNAQLSLIRAYFDFLKNFAL